MKGKKTFAAAGLLGLAILGVYWMMRGFPVAPKASGTNEHSPQTKLTAEERPSAPTVARDTPVTETPNEPKDTKKAKPEIAYDTSVPLKRYVGEFVRLTPSTDWRNAGNATLADAIQTEFWATAGGNVEYLAKAIVMDGSVRESIEKMLETAPASVRKECDTPEKFAAMMLSSGVGELLSVAVSSQRPISDTETRVAIDTLHVGAPNTYLHHEIFRKGPDGAWRRLITPDLVRDWAAGRGPKYMKGVPLKDGAPRTVRNN